MYLNITGSISVGLYRLWIFGMSEINKNILANFIKIMNLIYINFGHLVIYVNLTLGCIHLFLSLSLHSCLYNLSSSIIYCFLHIYIFH